MMHAKVPEGQKITRRHAMLLAASLGSHRYFRRAEHDICCWQHTDAEQAVNASSNTA